MTLCKVVVRQILAGEQSELAQVAVAEKPRFLESREQALVAHESRQQIVVTSVHGAQPAEMVEAEVVERQPLGRTLEERSDSTRESSRSVAHADHPIAECLAQHTARGADRIGEVDEPGVRRRAG